MQNIEPTIVPKIIKQLSFFDSDDERVVVTVYSEADRYRATIAGGWWMACGKTIEGAIAKVAEAYEREL